jgi:hypothetical protein
MQTAARVSYWTELSKVMKNKGADSRSKPGQNGGETWQPLAKWGLNSGIFYENGGIFRRKSLANNTLTKTRMDREFILNPDKDLRRKTTGLPPCQFAQHYSLERLAASDRKMIRKSTVKQSITIGFLPARRRHCNCNARV